jgi:putative membrane protein
MDYASPRLIVSPPAADRVDTIAYAAIIGLGALLSWLSADHPSLLPVWAPWDFSWPEYLGMTLVLFWYLRGLGAMAAAERPALWRRIAFLAGLALLYAVLQTRFEYLSQHMFFLNRTQHVVMHHLGPLLIALGTAGAAIKRGMPAWLARLIGRPIFTAPINVLQQPLLAAFLFVGSFYFWLIPDIHFRAMIDPRLYALMNWSMVLDGVLFWVLVLDPRPKPPARVSFGTRAALAFGVMFPQIILGAIITFTQRDLYPYYELCGRLYPSITALYDQHVGGIITWIPPAMMSVLALLLVINALRIHEESITETDDDASAMATLAKSWTGR